MSRTKNTPEHLRATWSDRYTVSDRGCHEWSRCRDSKGYGQIGFDGRLVGAHRVAYELFVGPIPDGMVVMHECDNPCCVNPAHLKVGTQADNMRDMWDKGRGVIQVRALPGPHWPIFLKRLNELGLSHARLAEKFGTSPSAVARAIRRAPKGKTENTSRVTNGRQVLPGMHWPIFLKRLNELGLSYRRLAKKFGVSLSTLERTINRAKNT